MQKEHACEDGEVSEMQMEHESEDGEIVWVQKPSEFFLKGDPENRDEDSESALHILVSKHKGDAMQNTKQNAK